MKVLIATDLHKPTINGIATFGDNLARGLVAAGHEVLVVAPSQTGSSYEETDEGGYRLARPASVIFPFYQNLRICLSPGYEMRRIVKKFRPDVIHVQTPLGIGIAATAAAKKYKIPLVATNHSMSENLVDNLKLLAPFAKQIDRILREIGNRFYNQADYVTLPTEEAVRMLRTGSFHKPCMAISNGIDLGRFAPGKPAAEFYAKYGVPADRPVALYFGRMDAEKHLPVLVRAAKQVLAARPEIYFVIAGQGTDYDRVRGLAHSLNLGADVTFPGRVDEADKLDFYRAASLFVMPSPAELQSIVTLEAMAVGLPVVAVKAGAIVELCQDGRNGFLYELDNADEFADKILQVLADQPLAAKMGAESLKIAVWHDLDETIRQYEKLYRRVAR